MQPSMKLPTWYRTVAIIVGLISIVLAFVVLIYPGLAVLTLIFLLAFALMFIGIDRLIAGVTGQPFGWMPLAAAPLAGPGAPASALAPSQVPTTPAPTAPH